MKDQSPKIKNKETKSKSNKKPHTPKRWEKAKAKIESNKYYSIEEAFPLLIKTGTAQFDESIDIAINLGVDPKQSDQQVRGACALPHGLGKVVKVLVFARGQKEIEAKEAGADFVGGEDMVEKIKKGWLDFDKVLATPDMMATVSKLAKILGPRGLMPNPKLGTVTMNIKNSVMIEKKGKRSFRTEKSGIVHTSIGKISMGAEKLKENYKAFLSTLLKAKPSSSKGVYLKAISISSTMGPSLMMDVYKNA